jgi:hypothetical protein
MPNPELLAYLSDNSSPLEADLRIWLESKRWEAFATAHRDKIRKKLRETRDPAALGDLRAELETAYLLLGEPRLSVAYEPLGRSRGPAPDYAVSYTTSLTAMLEVTRLRDLERLGDVVAAKLRQLVPDHPNVLLVWLAEEPSVEPELPAAMRRLKLRVEGGDQLLLDRARFATRADFVSQLGQLSELIVRPPATGGAALKQWSNPAARRPLPARVRLAILRALEATA